MLFVLFLFSVVAKILCHVDYTGHKLYHLYASDEKQMDYLRQLLEDDQVDTWKFPSGLNNMMMIRVAPDYIEHLEKDLKSNDIVFYIVQQNVQKLIEKERKENPLDDNFAKILDDFPLNVYHSFEAISAYIDSVASRYKNITDVVILGTTYENNLLKGLKIGTSKQNKPAIWIDAGIHAREWIAPATALYIIDKLVKGYTSSEIRPLLDTFDWYIFPVMNPDGYMYTWTHNRLWLKNRSPVTMYPLIADLLVMIMNTINTTDTLCRGVDIARNFDVYFGGSESSFRPCTNNYHGCSAFSEEESIAIRDGVLELGNNLKAFLSIHSFAQAWISPYASTEKFPPDQMAALKAVDEAINKVRKRNYTYGTIRNSLRAPHSGNPVDWAYDIANVKYSFEVQLRFTDDGYLIPNSQIIPVAEENFAGIKALANFIRSELHNN